MKRALWLLPLVLLFGLRSTAQATPMTTTGSISLSGGSTEFILPGDDPGFAITFSDGLGVTASASLDTVPLSGGDFLATSGSITITGGALTGTYSLLPGGPAVTGSTGNNGGGSHYYFTFDDIVYGPPQSPFLDGAGLLFVGGGREINLWGNSPTDYELSGLSSSGVGFFGTTDGTATLTAVPEPTSMLLLGTGLVGVGARRWRNRRQRS